MDEKPKKKNSDAKISANNEYTKKNYDRINIAVPKGQKAKLQAIAESKGKTVNGILRDQIETMIADAGL